MTNAEAICWLKLIKKELLIQPGESKRIAINKAINALKENALLEKDAEHYKKIAISRSEETKRLQAQNRKLVSGFHQIRDMIVDIYPGEHLDIILEINKVLEKAEGAE